MMDNPESERSGSKPPAPPSTPPSSPVDRVTVVLGNAVLPGLGYAFARRWWTAVAALAGAVVLFWLLVRTSSLGYEVLLAVWWALGIVHGALLRDAPAQQEERRRRHIALGAMVLAVLVLGVSLRYQAAEVAAEVESARSDGDCVAVRTAQGGLSFFVRASNAPLAAEGEQTVDACDRLDEAADLMERGLAGNLVAAKKGFAALDAARPGDGALARSALDKFLRGLDSHGPCVIASATDWLSGHDKKSALRERASDVADRKAPAALSKCGDSHMKAEQWAKARKSFQDLIADHPRSSFTDHARKELTQAKREIQLERVESRLDDGSYCAKPLAYEAAKAYGKGENRALFAYGNGEEHIKDLPGKWKTADAREATMIVCTGEPSDGEVVATCPYTKDDAPQVSFNASWAKVKIPVKVYELRTGKVVADRSVQIGGTSCPFRYKTFQNPLAGSTITESVWPSASDVRKAFAPLLKR